MTEAVEAAITQLKTVEAAISGVAVAYDQTPEALATFPAFINYPSHGETVMEASGQLRSLRTLIAELHVARGNLPVAESAARPFIDKFETAVFGDPTLAGTVETVNEIRHRYGKLNFGDETHLGIRFEVDVKIRRTI